MISHQPDDIFYDSDRKLVYVISGEGAVEVLRERDPTNYGHIGRNTTAPRACTGLAAGRSACSLAAKGYPPLSYRFFARTSPGPLKAHNQFRKSVCITVLHGAYVDIEAQLV
jgi:hypothetical protein